MNEMAVTTSSIMYGGKPILMVSRVVDDGTWMFLDGGPFSMADAMLVTLQTIVAHDSSVCELVGLGSSIVAAFAMWEDAMLAEAC